MGTTGLTNLTVGGNSNLYTATVTDTADVNGGTVSYKYFAPSIGSGWEMTTNTFDRAARLPAASGASVVLPAVFLTTPVPWSPTRSRSASTWPSRPVWDFCSGHRFGFRPGRLERLRPGKRPDQ